MMVAQWIVPSDLAEGQSIHVYLEMFPQLKKREPKGHVTFHKYRLLVSNGSLTSPVDVPGDMIEDALAQGKWRVGRDSLIPEASDISDYLHPEIR
ncbi:hypothetical protein SAMN05446635_6027 [Burkholderia sp. OK233]|nr:hypothetical protein SAMN05446635_6027 [Burkholderia sp. OK233]